MLTLQGWVASGSVTLTLSTLGEPGGVGDCDEVVSRRLFILAFGVEPADCFKVNWTVFVIVDPLSLRRTA